MTVTTPAGQPPPHVLAQARADKLLMSYVNARVTGLQAAYLNDSTSATAALAKLRRAVLARPGADPSVWFETLGGMPEELMGRGDEPSPFENAIHACLTLYAVHQQSQRGRMHQPGFGLGLSIRLLAKAISGDDPGNDTPVMRRFHALATAEALPETLHHLRGLLTQLRGEDIALDYGLLAGDLRRLQDKKTAPGVRLRWGRDLHRLERAAAPELTTTATTTGARE